MDWSSIKSLTIPDGNVTRVALNGNVIWSASDLPSGYTQLEYIKSSGSQYIDSGIIPVHTDTITIRYKHNAVDSVTTSFFGYMHSATTILPRIGFGSAKSNATYVSDFTGFNYTQFDTVKTDTNWHTVKIGYDGTNYYTQKDSDAVRIYTPDTKTLVLPATAYIFARHGSSGVQTYDGSGTCIAYINWYSADGTPRAKFIPAKRKSDNVLGMYDTVSKTFFTNKGTGSFTAG